MEENVMAVMVQQEVMAEVEGVAAEAKLVMVLVALVALD